MRAAVAAVVAEAAVLDKQTFVKWIPRGPFIGTSALFFVSNLNLFSITVILDLIGIKLSS